MMTRTAVVCLSVVALGACMNVQPYTVAAPAPAGARECVANKVAALGYTIEYQTADRSTVRARKGEGASGIDVILTTTVFTEGRADRVRVVTEAINHRGSPQEQRLGSLGHTRADADAVIAECGQR